MASLSELSPLDRARWILSLSYDMAEYHYRQGNIGQDEWERFCFLWRNGTPRFSHVAESYDVKNAAIWEASR
jgi:hypothetical protein